MNAFETYRSLMKFRNGTKMRDIVSFTHKISEASIASTFLKLPIQKPTGISQGCVDSLGIGVDIPTLCREGRLEEALNIVQVMLRRGIWVESYAYASLLQACASLNALQEGMLLHAHLLKRGIEGIIVVETKLVIMYVKCGSLADARQVFDKMPERNIFSWNAMIGGYAKHDHYKEAFELLYQMQRAGMQMDIFIFPSILKACAGLEALQLGKMIHCCLIKSGFEFDIFVGNALVDMYAKCRRIREARQVFDKMSQRDVVSWNAMIVGYSLNEEGDEALELFSQMKLAGVKLDSFTVASVLPECANLRDLKRGKEIHSFTIRSGFESDIFVGSALVDMYAKCRCLPDACHMFDKMSEKSVASWNAIIVAYAQNGHGDDALKLFRKMQLIGVKPNLVTTMSILPVCTNSEALQQGKEIHGYVIRSGLDSDVIVGSALVDMYAKCGSIKHARRVFDRSSERDVVLWNAMIAGYAMHGQGEVVLTLFHQMKQACMKPDDITLTSILSACSHAGLVNEGWQFFNCMSQDYLIIPTVEHYACMVDLLGRSGHLNEALDFINNMPLEPDACVWGALLGACRIHGNIEVAEYAAEHLFVLEPQNAGNYVLLSNIYAMAGRGDDVAKVRNLMNERGLMKCPGCSWIEVNNTVHMFLVGDKSHPQTQTIYAMLESLAGQMKEAGYAPDMNFVLRDVEEEDKKHILSVHSEKLAIVFGLINTCPGTPIRIIKNLRVCGDCHTASKFISKIVAREIFVRDANRFHHFRDGICSCGDYW